jgi:DNA-binding LacI/PurR family transcriptional regulator
MTDVARLAGVSTMTVSYAYSRPERVSADSAAKVRAAAEELGYPGPNPGARSLRTGRSGSLGVVLGEHLAYAFEDPQAARFLAGVAEVCAAHGIGMTLVPATGDDSDGDRVAEAAVDGFVVWTTSDDDPVVAAVAATGLPAVVHGGPATAGLGLVSVDDVAAARAIGAVAFATARRPAVLSQPLDRARVSGVVAGPEPSVADFAVTRHRLRGLRDAWTALGGEWSAVPVAVCPRNSVADGDVMATRLVELATPPDAIAAMSDELAFGALRAAARAGLAVPGDLVVTGWDDSDAAAQAGLTTVAQSLYEQGRLCALSVLDPEREWTDGPVEPPTWRIVHRASTRGAQPA